MNKQNTIQLNRQIKILDSVYKIRVVDHILRTNIKTTKTLTENTKIKIVANAKPPAGGGKTADEC